MDWPEMERRVDDLRDTATSREEARSHLLDLAHRQDKGVIRSSVYELPRNEQMALIDAGFGVLRDAMPSGDDAFCDLIFDGLSAVIAGWSDALITDIAVLWATENPEGPPSEVTPQEFVNAMGATLDQATTSLMAALAMDPSTDEQDFIYRVAAVAAGASEEMTRLLRQDSFPREEEVLRLFAAIVEGYTGMANGLPSRTPLPKFKLEPIDRKEDD